MRNSPYFECHSLADGVYVLEAKRAWGAMSNAGVIDMGTYTLVWDTFNTPAAGADLRLAAEELTGKPVRYVLNSHWHGDHVRGNQHFKDAVIVSTTRTRALMLSRQQEWLSRMSALLPQLERDIADLRRGAADGAEAGKDTQLEMLEDLKRSIMELEITPAALTFESALHLYGGRRMASFISVGAGHTECDAVLYLPEESILFTADLTPVGNHPLLVDGNPASWLEALDRLETYGAQRIVPGHGLVADGAAVHVTRTYIRELTEYSRIPADVREEKMPDQYAGWAAAENYTRNLTWLREREKGSQSERID
ncbi:MBL fold metallo-hydrolase [Paenibacillus glufosinatiresistens]|uniref:MBL fold metallo-hydrolase n=1 Tax=Paenibacillus glufosinatiresistens TaxID=3070657 RepID=UPI00286E38F7|nr:MBL fold metallo-hydrolase [Paenibacillus sp. YX.27]